MRVGVIRGGMEVEIWKRAQAEKEGTTVKDDNGNQIIRAEQQVTRVSEPFVSAGAA